MADYYLRLLVKGDWLEVTNAATAHDLYPLALAERQDGTTEIWVAPDEQKVRDWFHETEQSDEMFVTQKRRWGPGTMLAYGAVDRPGKYQ